MQRAPLGSNGTHSSSAAGSLAGDELSESGVSKRKTLEEREAEYALARERIYGGASTDTGEEPDRFGDEDVPNRATRQEEGEIYPVPRNAYGPNGSAIQPVYPSLYRPTAEVSQPMQPPQPSQPPPSLQSRQQPQQPQQQQTPQQPSQQYPTPDSIFVFQTPTIPYGQYGQMPMTTYGPVGNGYPSQGVGGQTPYAMQQIPYVNGSSTYMVQQSQNGYGQSWPQTPNMGVNGQPNGNMMSGMPQVGNTGWSYNGIPMVGPNQPMPMIPQGVQVYPQQQYRHPSQTLQQPNMYTTLAQPTPMRPGPIPHPHSSNSSSISSRSYQDYSRPHSRGSTTSTRSAASSVRLGVLYPAGEPPAPRYRQKGMKGQGFNGMTALSPGEKKSTRGHSPVCAILGI